MKSIKLVHYAIVFGTCLMLSGNVAQAQSDPEKVRLIEQEAVGWSRNMGQLMSVFTDDVIYEDAAMGLVFHGKEELRGFATAFFNGFPNDLKATITIAVVDGDRGASQWRFTGTQTGDLPNMPASNKSMDLRGASIYEFEGGKIKHKIDYWDLSAMLRQLGFMPAKQ